MPWSWNFDLVTRTPSPINYYSIICLMFNLLCFRGEYHLKGNAQYCWPPNWGNLCKKWVNNIFNVKSNWSKLDSTRRSTVLSIPLQYIFPSNHIPLKPFLRFLWIYASKIFWNEPQKDTPKSNSTLFWLNVSLSCLNVNPWWTDIDAISKNAF
jgi:hypothetical protein